MSAQINLDQKIDHLVETTQVYDIHTHLYDPAFGDLLLWGIDEQLIYHYLVAEGFRYFEMPYKKFWKLPKKEQADLIWDELFIKNSPISEACRGVLTSLNRLGLDVKKRDLTAMRTWFREQKVDSFVTHTMETANVKTICMTNSPFNDHERKMWKDGFKRDPRFTSALRIDALLTEWPLTARRLSEWGYQVHEDLGAKTMSEVRRFLADSAKSMEAIYVMVSFTPEFKFPDPGPCAQLIEKAVIPFCEEFGLPLALMAGVRKHVNSALRLAGAGVGLSNLEMYQNLIGTFPKNKFLLTALARENQHELCVLARKFGNLHVFGCWWFTNIPVIIEEMTRMRFELLGFSITPQHSDARVLEQIIYKWDHSRKIIAKVLKEKYQDIRSTGWEVTTQELERDIQNLFGGAFESFLKKSF